MKSRELRPVVGPLLKRWPGFSYDKRILFVSPIGSILRGVNFDPSAFSKTAMSLNAFVLPVCVPKDYLPLSFGDIVSGRGTPWSMDLPDLTEKLAVAIQEQAMPLLSTVVTPMDFVHFATRFMDNPHTWRARAYCLARAGETRQAIDMIDDYIPKLWLTSHWQKDIAEKSLAFRDLLASDPAAAARQLVEWEIYTIGKLGLAAYR